MSGARKNAKEVQKVIALMRQPDQGPSLHPKQGPVQLAAQQVAYHHAQNNSNGLTPMDLLALQRMVGNRQVQRMLARRVDSANVQQQNALAEVQRPFAEHPLVQRMISIDKKEVKTVQEVMPAIGDDLVRAIRAREETIAQTRSTKGQKDPDFGWKVLSKSVYAKDIAKAINDIISDPKEKHDIPTQVGSAKTLAVAGLVRSILDRNTVLKGKEAAAGVAAAEEKQQAAMEKEQAEGPTLAASGYAIEFGVDFKANHFAGSKEAAEAIAKRRAKEERVLLNTVLQESEATVRAAVGQRRTKELKPGKGNYEGYMRLLLPDTACWTVNVKYDGVTAEISENKEMEGVTVSGYIGEAAPKYLVSKI
jgi:hypothetical protein